MLTLGLGIKITGLSGLGGAVSYLATATGWDGDSVPFGSTTLDQTTPTSAPTLSGSYLEFVGNDYIYTQDAGVVAVGQSANYRVTIRYRPASGALVDGFVWSFGNTAINNDNTIQLRALATGQIRLSIDGNIGAGSSFFTTTMSSPMVGDGVYDIIVTYSDNKVTINVNGVDEILNSTHTGELPVGLNVFAVGCRYMMAPTLFMTGGFETVEVVAL